MVNKLHSIVSPGGVSSEGGRDPIDGGLLGGCGLGAWDLWTGLGSEADVWGQDRSVTFTAHLGQTSDLLMICLSDLPLGVAKPPLGSGMSLGTTLP